MLVIVGEFNKEKTYHIQLYTICHTDVVLIHKSGWKCNHTL